jgi:hypothetical protein
MELGDKVFVNKERKVGVIVGKKTARLSSLSLVDI